MVDATAPELNQDGFLIFRAGRHPLLDTESGCRLILQAMDMTHL